MIVPPSEIKAQALALKGRERLVTLMALKLVFPMLSVMDGNWAPEIEATKRVMRLKPSEAKAIEHQAARMADALKTQLSRA